MVIILNIRIIKEYIKKMTVNDVKKIGLKWDIVLDCDEAKKVYLYITKNYNNFFDGVISEEKILNDASHIFRQENYDKFVNLYTKYQNKNIR